MLTACILGIVLSWQVGCSGGDEQASSPPVPEVDPRFATAESLLDQFNLLTTREPVDVAAVMALFYAETPRQRELFELTQVMLPIYPLESAMQDRFKSPIDPSTPKAFINKANGPASITNRDGDRATATYKESDGTVETLQLVKYLDRWWLSGYSMEHHPKMKEMTDDQLAFSRLTLTSLSAVAPSMTTRVSAGEFKSAAEARTAMQAAIVQHMQQNPDQLRRLQELITRNPNLIPKIPSR